MENQNYYAGFACGDFNIIKKEQDSFFIAKGNIDNYKNEKDPLIGFYPEIVLKNRLNINLIYFDEYMRKSCESYFYYKTFKTKVAFMLQMKSIYSKIICIILMNLIILLHM